MNMKINPLKQPRTYLTDDTHLACVHEEEGTLIEKWWEIQEGEAVSVRGAIANEFLSVHDWVEYYKSTGMYEIPEDEADTLIPGSMA
jgi:hypothetical protein